MLARKARIALETSIDQVRQLGSHLIVVFLERSESRDFHGSEGKWQIRVCDIPKNMIGQHTPKDGGWRNSTAIIAADADDIRCEAVKTNGAFDP